MEELYLSITITLLRRFVACERHYNRMPHSSATLVLFVWPRSFPNPGVIQE